MTKVAESVSPAKTPWISPLNAMLHCSIAQEGGPLPNSKLPELNNLPRALSRDDQASVISYFVV